MGYFDALQKKWGEADTLFIAAFIGSFFLLFILIEPLISPFFSLKKGQEGTVIRTYLSRESQDLENKNQGKDTTTNPESKKPETLKAEKLSELAQVPPNIPAPANMPMPNQFTFGAAPNISNPSSSPLIGVGSGFHSRPSAPPGPKKTTDTASDLALENDRKQMGQEVERRQAQAELGQLMASLESNEQYQCTIRSSNQGKQNTGMQSDPLVRCTPSSAKAGFLEWIMKRLYAQELCANIAVSQSQGFQKKTCPN